MALQTLPMTGSARGSLIAICVLWALVAAVVFFRLLGRHRGVGIGLDDILAAVSFVRPQCYYKLHFEGNTWLT